MLLVILVKGYTVPDLTDRAKQFALTMASGFWIGLFVSLFFLLTVREARARAAMLKAEADRNLLAKQTIESELKLMQAQVEPHFLFNTLASVQYLTEIDPPQASKLLGHLLAYLRAALPQLRSASATLGQELDLAEAYLNILRMRMGERLAFTIDVPAVFRAHAFPPVLLISVVENAVTHGLEPQAGGGTIRIDARHENDRLVVSVTDTGRGLAGGTAQPGQGVGLTNVCERLSALFGAAGRFTLVDVEPHGARATIEIPYVDA
jgi:LytS/YehU family sensor histidine kinase